MSETSINRFEWMKAVLQSEELNPTAKAVASAMAAQFTSDATGQTNPKTTTLRDFLKISLSAVKRAISDLIKSGWLHRTEGRGNGSNTRYTLVSPGKIVAFKRSKEANAERKKGANLSPFSGPNSGFQAESESSNAGFHRPKNGLSYIEQSPEQKGRASMHPPSLLAFEGYRFTGNPFDGPTFVPSSDWQHLNCWAEWLEKESFPKLCQFPIVRQGNKNLKYFALPWRNPPADDRQYNEARLYFETLIEKEGLRHAAQ